MEGANGLSVRLELQADCFAGVWGNRSQAQLDWINQADVNAALNAASAVATIRCRNRRAATPCPTRSLTVRRPNVSAGSNRLQVRRYQEL